MACTPHALRPDADARLVFSDTFGQTRKSSDQARREAGMFDDQRAYDLRFEWGEAGIRRLAPISEIVVVVDVLSFATAVDVAVSRGALVYPSRWRDERAEELAAQVDAILAGARSGQGQRASFSLSPTSLQTIPPGTRLVLPSPNGATLSQLATEHDAVVLAGCLRNASAVAGAARAIGGTVAVIAAGERWVQAGELTGSLRPAVEDLVGAGAILAALDAPRPSPEAVAAMSAWRAVKPNLVQFLASCASGQELQERGLAPDVDLAAQFDVSQAVPYLDSGAFRVWKG
jgi:2-phosphosulfolactate phosphatase